MKEFMGYTIGLECWIGKHLTMTTVEYNGDDESVTLKAVSGKNLATLRSVKTQTIPRDAYDNRPRDAYDSSVEAIWALDMLGLAPARLDN